MFLVMTTLFFSIFITISLVPLFSRLSVRLHAMDIPDRRKVHKKSMPRLGGVAMALGVLTTAIILLPKAEKSGYKIKRYDLIDKIFKGKLKVLKERGIL